MDPQDAKFIEARLNGKNKTDSAMIAFGTKNKKVASVQAARTLKKPAVRHEMQRLLKQQGITLKKALKPIADALEATKIVSSPTEPDYTIPDHTVRLHASDRALKLLNDIKVDQNPPLRISDETKLSISKGDIHALERIVFKDDKSP